MLARNGIFALVATLLVSTMPSTASAGMTWSARAIDPALVAQLKSDDLFLEDTLFGRPPAAITDTMKRDGRVEFSDQKLMKELQEWAEKRANAVGDTGVDLDKAWHGIHYLLTGSAEPDGTLASKVIFGGEDIGKDQGYGPAQLLMPDEVRAIARLLQSTPPETLRQRFRPADMTRVGVYPDVIWVRDGEEALHYVLEAYGRLVSFYKLAAERGQAVVFAIT